MAINIVFVWLPDVVGRQLVDSTFDTRDLDEAFTNSRDDGGGFGEDITNVHKRMTQGITNPAYLPQSQKPLVCQRCVLCTRSLTY